MEPFDFVCSASEVYGHPLPGDIVTGNEDAECVVVDRRIVLGARDKCLLRRGSDGTELCIVLGNDFHLVTMQCRLTGIPRMIFAESDVSVYL